jgi:hypothetical protein
MTPSEHLWALAAERANAPEHMRELFALAIDRAVSTEVAQINRIVGRSPRWERGFSSENYENLLREYVGLKLHLHSFRKMALLHEDDPIELTILRQQMWERCCTLKKYIKAKRAAAQFAAWGDLTPEK